MNPSVRAFVIVTGFIWGLCRGMTPARTGGAAGVSGGRAKEEAGEDRFVTTHQLAEALRQSEERTAEAIEQRLGNQSLAIDSLKAMIQDTDALLERVLERLEHEERDGATEPMSFGAPESESIRISPR